MEQAIYLISLVAYLIIILWWMARMLPYLSFRLERSRWKHQQLQLHTGLLLFIIADIVSYLAFYLFFREQGVGPMFWLTCLFSGLTIPQCGLTVYSFADRRLITWRLIFLHYLVPVLLFATYGALLWFSLLNQLADKIILICASAYYVVYALAVFFACRRNAHIFSQRLEDSYVEVDGRQVLYRNRAIFYCLGMFVLFIVFVFEPNYITHTCYFVISAFGWSYFSGVIINMKDSPLANTMQPEAETPGAEPEPEPTNADLVADSPTMLRLNAMLDKVLVDDQLYTDPNLDINGLARALATNRTYVGRVFRMRGTTFSRYVNSLRLNHAEELLRTTNLSLSAICTECGFSDATFRRQFVERYNCTPVEYRKTLLLKR